MSSAIWHIRRTLQANIILRQYGCHCSMQTIFTSEVTIVKYLRNLYLEIEFWWANKLTRWWLRKLCGVYMYTYLFCWRTPHIVETKWIFVRWARRIARTQKETSLIIFINHLLYTCRLSDCKEINQQFTLKQLKNKSIYMYLSIWKYLHPNPVTT